MMDRVLGIMCVIQPHMMVMVMVMAMIMDMSMMIMAVTMRVMCHKVLIVPLHLFMLSLCLSHSSHMVMFPIFLPFYNTYLAGILFVLDYCKILFTEWTLMSL